MLKMKVKRVYVCRQPFKRALGWRPGIDPHLFPLLPGKQLVAASSPGHFRSLHPNLPTCSCPSIASIRETGALLTPKGPCLHF